MAVVVVVVVFVPNDPHRVARPISREFGIRVHRLALNGQMVTNGRHWINGGNPILSIILTVVDWNQKPGWEVGTSSGCEVKEIKRKLSPQYEEQTNNSKR